MTERKRRRGTPGFGIPPPFSPITGTHATLRVEGIYPYCAMMQVAAADTYDDYVICRGFDPRIRKFIDYEAGNADKPGISVAKPFGNRTTGSYTIAEVYPAFLPTQGAAGQGGLAEDYTPPSPTDVDWRVGQNAGTAPTASAGGQPSGLDVEITELIDHNSKYVQWMLIDSGQGGEDAQWFRTKENWTSDWTDDQAAHYVVCHPCDDYLGANTDSETEVTVRLPSGYRQDSPRTGHNQDPNVVASDVIAAVLAEDGSYTCVSDYLDDKVGTVKMWVSLYDAVPEGWVIMDGVENSVANGGSGLNMTGRFVRGSGRIAGNTGGWETHTHQVDVDIEPHSTTELAFAINHTHAVTVAEHSVVDLEHEHPIDTITPSIGADDGVVPDWPYPYMCTGAPEDYSGSHTCDDTDWGPLAHAEAITSEAFAGGQVPPHALEHDSGDSITDEVSNIPPYTDLIFIERIDNSI